MESSFVGNQEETFTIYYEQYLFKYPTYPKINCLEINRVNFYVLLHCKIWLSFCFQYALRSAVEMAGLNPDEALVELQPREGELTLRTEDILDAIDREGESLAVALFSGVHYYTGQKFDIKTITKAAQDKGAYAGNIRQQFLSLTLLIFNQKDLKIISSFLAVGHRSWNHVCQPFELYWLNYCK